MNPSRIFTRQTLGLDNKVWLVMIAVIAVSLGLLSYNVIHKKECADFTFNVRNLGSPNDSVFYVGDILSFSASNKSQDINWDFGDNDRTTGIYVSHAFMKEGAYLVRANSNSLCPVIKEIIVKVPLTTIEAQSDAFITGKIIGNSTCTINTSQIFSYPGQAKSYEWSVQNQPKFGIKKGQSVSFSFPYPGSYKIQVRLDNDFTKLDFLELQVLDVTRSQRNMEEVPILIPRAPAPPSQNPPPNKKEIDTVVIKIKEKSIQIINDKLFLSYLEDVINKTKEVSDFADYGIKENTPVIVNGKEHRDFKWLCKELPKIKKNDVLGITTSKKQVKLETASLQRTNNIVSIINVTYSWKKVK